MTIGEAITLCDAQKPNGYSNADKIHWLDKLDRMIWRELFQTHELADGEPTSFSGYTVSTATTTSLLADDAYTDLYVKWLFAQIDFANAEELRYNNSMQMYNALYMEYANWFNRTHLPKQPNNVRGIRAERGVHHDPTPLD